MLRRSRLAQRAYQYTPRGAINDMTGSVRSGGVQLSPDDRPRPGLRVDTERHKRLHEIQAELDRAAGRLPTNGYDRTYENRSRLDGDGDDAADGGARPRFVATPPGGASSTVFSSRRRGEQFFGERMSHRPHSFDVGADFVSSSSSSSAGAAKEDDDGDAGAEGPRKARQERAERHFRAARLSMEATQHDSYGPASRGIVAPPPPLDPAAAAAFREYRQPRAQLGPLWWGAVGITGCGLTLASRYSA